MKDFLYFVVDLVAKAHAFLLRLNDSFELYLNDKQLHFLVMGVAGFLLFLAVRWLFSKLRPNAVAWVYTFTVMGTLALAIEIGQAVTHTGNMELADIAMGMWGVLAFGAVYTVLHYIIKAIRKKGGNRQTKS
jgi:glycopeptide antibiotics resistance protein